MSLAFDCDLGHRHNDLAVGDRVSCNGDEYIIERIRGAVVASKLLKGMPAACGNNPRMAYATYDDMDHDATI